MQAPSPEWRAGMQPLELAQTQPLAAHLVLIEDVENKCGELGGVSKWKELLVDLLEASGVQLPAGAVLNEALVPADGRAGGRECHLSSEPLPVRPRKA